MRLLQKKLGGQKGLSQRDMGIGNAMADAQTFKLNLTHKGAPSLFQAVEVKLQKGIFYQVEGGNGTGKTTLLKTIAYSLTAHNDIQKKLPQAWRSHKPVFYYLPHTPPFVLSLTVEETLLLYTKLFHLSFQKVDQLLQQWAIEDKKHSTLSHLSQGERQRLSLCQMLLHNKPVWLLDEPFTSLDQSARITLKQCIETKLNDGGMVCMSSHETIPFDNIAKKIIRLPQV